MDPMRPKRIRKPLDPIVRRDRNFRSRYGLSAGEVANLIASQNGRCAICLKPAQRPVVDHDHKTGKPRAILCHGCNIKLPAIEDVHFLVKALAYLGRFRV